MVGARWNGVEEARPPPPVRHGFTHPSQFHPSVTVSPVRHDFARHLYFWTMNKLHKERFMTTISDDFMRQMLSKTKNYCIIILKAGPNHNMDGVQKILWEHARRNFELRAAGMLSIVCPVADDSDINGIGIFNAPAEEVKKIMDDDPGVKAGVFVYELHTCRSFPGDSLPG
jgi:hypothetical protein